MSGLLKIILLVIAVIVVIVLLNARKISRRGGETNEAARRAGKLGEEVATDVIQSVLKEEDHLFTNKEITFDGKPTELDNVVVNKYGVFIFEVKNYVGKLCGGEDDFEWSKYKTTDAGNTYEKTVKNPIRQVKRQEYILAGYLENHGCEVWVEGRAILLHGNSPVKSDYVLSTIEDIDRTVHTPGRNKLSKGDVEKICSLMS